MKALEKIYMAALQATNHEVTIDVKFVDSFKRVHLHASDLYNELRFGLRSEDTRGAGIYKFKDDRLIIFEELTILEKKKANLVFNKLSSDDGTILEAVKKAAIETWEYRVKKAQEQEEEAKAALAEI